MIKKRLTLLLTVLTILLTACHGSATSDKELQAKFERQVYNNEVLKNHIIAQDKIISDQDEKIQIQEVKEKERMLLSIFGVGISKDEVKGALFGVLAVQVHPLFLLGFLF